MIANPDKTLYAIYGNHTDGYDSRPVLAIDETDGTTYVATPDGGIAPADYYPDLAYITEVEHA